MSTSTSKVRRWVRTFVSVFDAATGAKVTVESDGKTFRMLRIVDGAHVDPRSMTFVTQRAAIAAVTARAIGGEKRAVTARALLVDPRLIPTSGRRTFADMVAHMATVSDGEAFGTTQEQRLALASRMVSQRSWPVSDQL